MNPHQVERVERMLGLDPFIKQVSVLVPGWLRPGNIRSFRHALAHLPNDAPLLEIGSFAGLSTVILLYLIKDLGIRNALFTCDPWSQPEGQTDARVTEPASQTFGQLREYVRDSFVRNVSYFSPDNLPASYQMTSDEFFGAWNKGENRIDLFGRAHGLGGTFAFVYVDGSHKHPVVQRDFENVDPLLEPGGFILFDDSEANGTGGPSRVAAEVVRSPQYELIQQAPNALMRKRGSLPGIG